ncbi:hypothetical protein BJY04DRAFT_220785 [Aspergillus karnatakaensis]|uniref:SDR family oxidoreductase n=1 Tax=Aspergillus karnatakaensis TaxID=1810916 RepID=UPI003CCD0D1D
MAFDVIDMCTCRWNGGSEGRRLRSSSLVTGANGISGHAIVEHLIRTPKDEWAEIIVTSRKPPRNFWVDPRVRFISLDFLEDPATLVPQIKDICKNVTHAIFTSYIHDSDLSKLGEKNCPLFRHFLEAVDSACPLLERVCLQTGGKHYGIQFQPITTPCYEDSPRYTGPGSETIFYYKQEDDLFELQKRRNRNTWDYNIIRPFGIIGYTPQFSGMNEALPLAQYFLICRERNEPPVFPGNYAGWHQVEMQSYAPSIADMSIWASATPAARNQAFNHGNGDPVIWRFLWEYLVQYFYPLGVVNIEDCAPGAAQTEKQVDLATWVKDKKSVWEKIVARDGGMIESFQEHSFALMDGLLSRKTPGCEFMASVRKARGLGWARWDDSYEGWGEVLRGYENAGVLPRLQR